MVQQKRAEKSTSGDRFKFNLNIFNIKSIIGYINMTISGETLTKTK